MSTVNFDPERRCLQKNEHTTMVCFFRFSRKTNQIIAHHGEEEGGGSVGMVGFT